MPRFYFHLHDDLDVPDDIGIDLRSLEEARAQARHLALFTLAQTVKDEGRFNLDHRVDIEDSDGRVLDTVRFRDVVEISGS